MPQTILIVDDEKRLVSLVQSYLAQEGYRVVAAYNGKDALPLAQKEKPDLIILDIMMPEMNGYDFMRAHRAESDTPIIMLTAKVEDDDKIIGLGSAARPGVGNGQTCRSQLRAGLDVERVDPLEGPEDDRSGGHMLLGGCIEGVKQRDGRRVQSGGEIGVDQHLGCDRAQRGIARLRLGALPDQLVGSDHQPARVVVQSATDKAEFTRTQQPGDGSREPIIVAALTRIGRHASRVRGEWL